MSAAPASLTWFARHELSLAWREWLAMMTGGRRTRGVALFIVLAVVAALLHLMAYGLVGPWVATGIVPDKATLVLLTGGGLLFWSVMLSQAMESVTRAYYARSDLDLILSSPASSRRVFAVRTGAIALSTVALACLLASPLIDMLVVLDGPQWLAAYGVLAAARRAVGRHRRGRHHRPVPPRRPQAHPPHRPDRRRHRRRRLRHRHPGRRDPLLRQLVALLGVPVRRNHRRRARSRKARSGCPPAPPWAISRRSPSSHRSASAPSPPSSPLTASSYGRHAIAAAGLSHIRSQRRTRRRSVPPHQPAPGAPPQGMDACCSAIPGCCRRR